MMRNYSLLFFAIALVLLSCDKKSNSNGSISVQKVEYSGCFSTKGTAQKSTLDEMKDSLYYVINNSILSLHVDKVYPCCGLLTDSVVIRNNVLSVYLTDENKNSFACKCICLFKINYAIVDYQQKNVDFKVYIKNSDADNFSLWKEIWFINGLD